MYNLKKPIEAYPIEQVNIVYPPKVVGKPTAEPEICIGFLKNDNIEIRYADREWLAIWQPSIDKMILFTSFGVETMEKSKFEVLYERC